VSGNVLSNSSEWVSPPIRLLPPRDFRATVTAEGTRFSWTNRSTHAAFLELDSTRLEPSATTLLLPTFPWPGTTYELALVSGGALAFSNAITLESFRIPATVATLDAGGLRPSQSGAVNIIARSAAGAWEMVAGFSCEESRPQSGAVLDASVHCLDPTGGLMFPGLRLDDAGNPHLLVSTFDTALQRRTHHQWRDRDGWHSEILPLDVGSVRTFDVDAAGRLRLLTSRASPSATEYGELVDGIWNWTVVPGSDAMSEFSFRVLSRASDGTPQILMQDSVGLVAVALRQLDGSFVSESIGSTAAAALVTGAGGKPGVAFVRAGMAFFVQREQGSWLAPEQIADVKFGTRIWAASTPDGTRVDAVFVQPSDLGSRSRVDLWRRGGAGWRGMTLASGDVLEVTGGYVSEGKLWIAALAGLRQPPTPFEWATWQEP